MTTQGVFALTLAFMLQLGTCFGCSRVLPEYQEQFSFSSLTGTVQLLIPSWRFNCRGTITRWEAYVQGNTTSPDADIEFQAFRPDVTNSANFILVYGNQFDPNEDSRNGSKITMKVNPNLRFQFPIENDSIVGVRLNSSSLGLLYDPIDGVDVYYWDDQGPGRSCNFSLCDPNVKVLRDVTPLFSWTFESKQSLVVPYLLLPTFYAGYCSTRQLDLCSKIPMPSATFTGSLAELMNTWKHESTGGMFTNLAISTPAVQQTPSTVVQQISSSLLKQTPSIWVQQTSSSLLKQTPSIWIQQTPSTLVHQILSTLVQQSPIPTEQLVPTDGTVAITGSIVANPSASGHSATSFNQNQPQSTTVSINSINFPSSTLTVTPIHSISPETDTGATDDAVSTESVPMPSATLLSPTANVSNTDLVETQLFTALFSLVMGLLGLAIALTAILNVLLIARCAKRYCVTKPQVPRTKNGIPPPSGMNRNFRSIQDLTTSDVNALPQPLEEERDIGIELEDRDYAEVAEYSVPRPSWLIMQASPPYANTASLLAEFSEPSYENTSYF